MNAVPETYTAAQIKSYEAAYFAHREANPLPQSWTETAFFDTEYPSADLRFEHEDSDRVVTIYTEEPSWVRAAFYSDLGNHTWTIPGMAGTLRDLTGVEMTPEEIRSSHMSVVSPVHTRFTIPDTVFTT